MAVFICRMKNFFLHALLMSVHFVLTSACCRPVRSKNSENS